MGASLIPLSSRGKNPSIPLVILRPGHPPPPALVLEMGVHWLGGVRKKKTAPALPKPLLVVSLVSPPPQQYRGAPPGGPSPPPLAAPRALLTQPWPVLELPQLGEGTRAS